MKLKPVLKAALPALLSLAIATASAQQIRLVNALASTLGPDYQVVESVMMGGKLYFSTKDDRNTSLWKTDGTTASMLYKWTYGGNYTLNKLYVLNGNQLLFTGFDSAHGKELWTSDGTVAGTKLLKDIAPGPTWSMAAKSALNIYFNLTHQAFAFKDGYAYFCASANPSDTGNRLWRTDGTRAGTVQVPDFMKLLPTESFGANVGFVNGKFILSYFSNHSLNNGRVSTDGTIPGTTVFSETNSVEDYYSCNGNLLYGQNGLSITDGSIAGTSVLDSSNAFTNGDIATISNKVYFFSRNNLFVTDGTPVGTNKVADTVVPLGLATAFLSITQTLDNKNVRLSVLDNKLYFMSDKAMLWESDGTKAGTKPMLQATSIGSNGSGGIYKLTALNGKLYFRGVDSFRVWLYESDGTATGTHKVRNPASTYLDMRLDNSLPAGPGRYQPYVDEIMTVNNKILLTALYDSTIGKALYALDLPTEVKEPPHTPPSLTVYPNPTPGHLNLRYPANHFDAVFVSDATGLVVSRQLADGGGKQELDLNALPKGAYYIWLSGSGGNTGTVVLLQ